MYILYKLVSWNLFNYSFLSRHPGAQNVKMWGERQRRKIYDLERWLPPRKLYTQIRIYSRLVPDQIPDILCISFPFLNASFFGPKNIRIISKSWEGSFSSSAYKGKYVPESMTRRVNRAGRTINLPFVAANCQILSSRQRRDFLNCHAFLRPIMKGEGEKSSTRYSNESH